MISRPSEMFLSSEDEDDDQMRCINYFFSPRSSYCFSVCRSRIFSRRLEAEVSSCLLMDF